MGFERGRNLIFVACYVVRLTFDFWLLYRPSPTALDMSVTGLVGIVMQLGMFIVPVNFGGDWLQLVKVNEYFAKILIFYRDCKTEF